MEIDESACKDFICASSGLERYNPATAQCALPALQQDHV